MNFWQGKTIKLRSIEPSDATFFIESNLNSERGRNLDFVWPPVSQASVLNMTEEAAKRTMENDTFHWIIEDTAGAPVGSIDTHHCNPRTGTFSYGIDIIPGHQRRGYAREAILIVLKYYFEELRYQKVTVPVHGDNEASIRLHEKIGFQKEGALRRMIFTHGQYFDELWYGLTAEEFQNVYQEYQAIR
jgi:RimJ/RimL family protein N-acetyltransferase